MEILLYETAYRMCAMWKPQAVTFPKTLDLGSWFLVEALLAVVEP
jgi:hypothetical protein